MVSYEWYKAEVPTYIKVKQVYGLVFSDDGNIILRVDEDKYKLTGGKPENIDKDYFETLKREYKEELNVEIKDIYYLGYLLVKEKNEQYAQIRMIARIENIGENRPDTDGGRKYKRFMSLQTNIKEYLKYTDSAGNKMIDDAIEFAKQKYIFNVNNKEEYYI